MKSASSIFNCAPVIDRTQNLKALCTSGRFWLHSRSPTVCASDCDCKSLKKSLIVLSVAIPRRHDDARPPSGAVARRDSSVKTVGVDVARAVSGKRSLPPQKTLLSASALCSAFWKAQ